MHIESVEKSECCSSCQRKVKFCTISELEPASALAFCRYSAFSVYVVTSEM